MSIKYEKIGLRRDRNLSDLTDSKEGLTNILNDLALPGEKFIGDDLFVINNLAQTNIRQQDWNNFAGIAVDSTQLRYVIRISAETISETLLFDPGFKFFLGDFEIEVLNASTPIDPTVTENPNNRWEFNLILQTTVKNVGINVGDLLDLNNQPVWVNAIEDPLKTTNVFTVEPLITMRDQAEFFRLNTGFEQMFGLAGRGPVAKFYASDEINPAFDLLNENNPTNLDETFNISGDTIVSHAGNNESPLAFGPIKFWDHGSFIFSNLLFDTARFSDGHGVVQWEGFLALNNYSFSLSEDIFAKTNGEFLWEVWDDDTGTWQLIGSLINGFEVQIEWDNESQTYLIVDNGLPSDYHYVNIVKDLRIKPWEVIPGGPLYNMTLGEPGVPWRIESGPLFTQGPNNDKVGFQLYHNPGLSSNPDYNYNVLPNRVQLYNQFPSTLSNISSVIRYFKNKTSDEYVKTRVTLIFKNTEIPYERKYFNVTQGENGLPFYRWYDTYDATKNATNIESLDFYEENAIDNFENIIDSSLKINDLSLIKHEPTNTRNFYTDIFDHYNTYRFDVLPSTNNLDRTVIMPTMLISSSNSYQVYDYKDYSGKSFKRGDYVLNIQRRGRALTSITRFVRNVGNQAWFKSSQLNTELTDKLDDIYTNDYDGEQKQQLDIDIFKSKLPAISTQQMSSYYDDNVMSNHNTNLTDKHFHYPPSFYNFIGDDTGWAEFKQFNYADTVGNYGNDINHQLFFASGDKNFVGESNSNSVDFTATLGSEPDEDIIKFHNGYQVPVTESLIIPVDGVVDVWFENNQGIVSVMKNSSDPTIQQQGVGPEYVAEGNLIYTMKLNSDDFFANDFSKIVHVYNTDNLATNNNVINIQNHGFAEGQLVLVSDHNTGALGSVVSGRVNGDFETERTFMLVDRVDADNFRLWKNVSDGTIAGTQGHFTTPEQLLLLTSNDVQGGDICIMSFGIHNNEGTSIGGWDMILNNQNQLVNVNFPQQMTVYGDRKYDFSSLSGHSILTTSEPQPAGFEQYIQWEVIGPFSFSNFPAQYESRFVIFSGLLEPSFNNRVFPINNIDGKWIIDAPQNETSSLQNLMGPNTEMIILTKADEQGEYYISDNPRVFKYWGANAQYNNRITSLYSDNKNNEIITAYSYNDETGAITYSVDNYQNSSMRNIIPGRAINSTVDVDSNCTFVHIIQTDRGLSDYSKLTYCEGVIGRQLVADVPAGSTSLTLKNTGTEISVGQIIQFANYIPNATIIQSIDTSQSNENIVVTISNPTIKELKADYTVTISNDNLNNYEVCTAILNTAPPFEGTEEGLKTVSSSESLQVNEVLFDKMKLDAVTLQTLTPELGVEYSNTLDINYEAPNGQIRSFKLLSK